MRAKRILRPIAISLLAGLVALVSFPQTRLTSSRSKNSVKITKLHSLPIPGG
jgi:hypothetical protein